MKEFLKSLGINDSGTISDNGNYVINFKTDRDWSKAESKLEKADDLYIDDDASSVGMEISNIQFVNDDFTITMTADFDNDVYTLVCREN